MPSGSSSTIPPGFPHDVSMSERHNMRPPRPKQAKVLGRELPTYHQSHTDVPMNSTSQSAEESAQTESLANSSDTAVSPARADAHRSQPNPAISMSDILPPAVFQGLGFTVEKYVKDAVSKRKDPSATQFQMNLTSNTGVDEYFSAVSAQNGVFTGTTTPESTPHASSGSSSPKSTPSSATTPPSYGHLPEGEQCIDVLDLETSRSDVRQGSSSSSPPAIKTAHYIYSVDWLQPKSEDELRLMGLVGATPPHSQQSGSNSSAPIYDPPKVIEKEPEAQPPLVCSRCPVLEAERDKQRKKAHKFFKHAERHLKNSIELEDQVANLKHNLEEGYYSEKDGKMSVGELTFAEKKEGIVKVVTKYREQLFQRGAEVRDLRLQLFEQNEQLSKMSQEKGKQEEMIAELWEQLRQRDIGGSSKTGLIFNAAPRPADGGSLIFGNLPIVAEYIGMAMGSDTDSEDEMTGYENDTTSLTSEEGKVADAEPEEEIAEDVGKTIKETPENSDLSVSVTFPDVIQPNITQHETPAPVPQDTDSQSEKHEAPADLITSRSIVHANTGNCSMSRNNLASTYSTSYASSPSVSPHSDYKTLRSNQALASAPVLTTIVEEPECPYSPSIHNSTPVVPFFTKNDHQPQAALADLNADSVAEEDFSMASEIVRTTIGNNIRPEDTIFDPFRASYATEIKAERPVAADLIADPVPDEGYAMSFNTTRHTATYNTFSFDPFKTTIRTMRPASIANERLRPFHTERAGHLGTACAAPIDGGQPSTTGSGRTGGVRFAGPASSFLQQAPLALSTAWGALPPTGSYLPSKSRFF
ncbi:uncharacterized protein BDZ99DRAFT_475105 [Mytilinidion resinicola]|uniref:Uncharacterized protein n=1 Tax=Mytilinidion resinicola TaxID=574789 RepID=A0A6A6YT67_9PEZI|nr:uncharacterized protein BDZ99DRAFT_475105 [Mytilinidion resinicola]KAF2811563.1 hypothetical protein BDZ99DRAFT_475105 [Mytilinidion resinicola]